MSATTQELCRIVLVTPHRTLELALPAAVPLCDLVPVLVQRATTFGSTERREGGRRGRGRGLTGEEDWVIQRLGSGPLDEELTPDALQIRDGETLYLRPRDGQLPPAHFDDLIDGLATGVRARPDRWRDSMTRILFLAIGGLALLASLISLFDPAFTLRRGVAAAIAVLAVGTSALFSRALDDGWAALLCGLAAVPFAALAGFLVPGSLGPQPAALVGIAPQLLAAFAAGTGTAVMAMAAVGTHRPVFLAVWLTGAAGALAALLVVLGLGAAEAGGAVLTLVLITATYAPSVSFRLARLRLPALPTGADDLSEDIEPYPAPELMAGAALADTYLTAILLAAGTVATTGTVLLVRHGGATAYGMTVALATLLLIRSRGLTSAWQRIANLVPALTGLLMLAVHVASNPDTGHRLVALLALLFVAGTLLGVSRALPGRRLLPYWGRLADIAEYLAAAALIVLLLGLLDAFQWARALAG